MRQRNGAPPPGSAPLNPQQLVTAEATALHRHVARLAGAIARLPVEYLPLVIVAVQIAYRRADQEYAARRLEDYLGGRWHRHHPLTSARELDRRRWPPNGNRAEWVAHGGRACPAPPCRCANVSRSRSREAA